MAEEEGRDGSTGIAVSEHARVFRVIHSVMIVVAATSIWRERTRRHLCRVRWSGRHHHQIVVTALTVHERDGRFMATADLGEDSRDVGLGETPQEAVRAALRSLGEPYASEMAENLTG